jgi:hypothetical protein
VALFFVCAFCPLVLAWFRFAQQGVAAKVSDTTMLNIDQMLAQ